MKLLIILALAGCKLDPSASHHCVYDLGGTSKTSNCHTVKKQVTYNDQPMTLQLEQCDIVCVITSTTPSEKQP